MFFEQLQNAVADISGRVLQPFSNFVSGPDNRWYFLYIAMSLLIGFSILLRSRYNARKTLASNLKTALTALFPSRVLLHRSSLLDYRYAVVNHVLTVTIIVYWVGAVGIFSDISFQLFAKLTILQGVGLEMGWLGAVLTVFIYAFAYDTSNFFQHYLQHKSPILWEFHKVHHSAEVLNPVTAVRTHPVSYMLSATITALVFGALNGLAFNLFAGQVAHYGVLAMNLFGLLFFTVGLYHLKHSHIWFTYPAFIKEVFASPSLHFIHHSDNPRHYDKNFGFVFNFWDKVFGSYYDPDDEEQYDLVFGISESEGRGEYRTVRQLYLTPFRRAWVRHIKPVIFRSRDLGRDVSQKG